MIIDEVKELGFMDNETQQIKVLTENIPCTTSRVVNGKFADVDELSLININKTESGAVVSRYYKGIEGDHSDAIIVAMRGRNPENPSDRTVGAPTEQRLEPNSQGICNTLTSVTKDNLVMERKCISTKGKENDVASTILSGYERSNMTGFNADNGVLEYKAIDEQNMCVRDETFGTLTTDGSSPKHNNRVLEQYYLSEKGKQYVCDPKRGMCTDINADVCQTLTAKGQSNWTGSFVSPDIDRLEKSTNIGSEEPTLIHLKNGRTITSNDCLTQYRIRKLTPRECGRLMGVDDEDIDKMLAVNSNSQAYKQYGNSIVKQCLIAIFSQMGIQGIPRWNEGLSDKYK